MLSLEETRKAQELYYRGGKILKRQGTVIEERHVFSVEAESTPKKIIISFVDGEFSSCSLPYTFQRPLTKLDFEILAAVNQKIELIEYLHKKRLDSASKCD